MGSVFRKCVTRPVPASATIATQNGKRVAGWRSRQGKWFTGEVVTSVDGKIMVRMQSGTYFAKFRRSDGVQVVPTGCRSEDAARQVLARLERDAERVKVGVVTPTELATADAATGAVKASIEDYIATLTPASMHAKNTRTYLARLAEALHWQRLVDLKRIDLELWLAEETRRGRSARSRNAYHIAAKRLRIGASMSDFGRLGVNPFSRMARANADADGRRPRRADRARRLHPPRRGHPNRPRPPRGYDRSYRAPRKPAGPPSD